MPVALRAAAKRGMARGKLAQRIVIGLADRFDMRAVMADKFHRDEIRKACQLFLSVGDERTELAQAVERAADQQAAGRIQAAGEALADGDEVRLQTVLRNRKSVSYHALDWISSQSTGVSVSRHRR